MARPVDKAVRRQEILRAGQHLVEEGGLGALQMREVAGRANVALGTLYIYFPTKESLFTALYARRTSEIRDLIEQLNARPEADLRSLFVSFATAYREVYRQFGRHVDTSTLYSAQTTVDPLTLEELQSATSDLRETMSGVLEKFHVAQPEVALPVLWSLLSGLAAHYSGPRAAYHQVDWNEALQFAADRVLAALMSPIPDSASRS